MVHLFYLSTKKTYEESLRQSLEYSFSVLEHCPPEWGKLFKMQVKSRITTVYHDLYLKTFDKLVFSFVPHRLFTRREFKKLKWINNSDVIDQQDVQYNYVQNAIEDFLREVNFRISGSREI